MCMGVLGGEPFSNNINDIEWCDFYLSERMCVYVCMCACVEVVILYLIVCSQILQHFLHVKEVEGEGEEAPR